MGPGLDKDVQLRRDMSLLESNWQSRLVVRDHRNKLSLSLLSPLPCVHRLCIIHGTTERVVPDLAKDVWMTCSHNHWASTETLQQLFSKMEGMVNEHTPGQDFAVLMDMALIHISAETKQMLQEEFGHIRVIMIPPHTTSFLQLCDVGLVRPFKSTTRRTACETYARAIYNNTDDIGSVEPTAVPDLRAQIVRLTET